MPGTLLYQEVRTDINLYIVQRTRTQIENRKQAAQTHSKRPLSKPPAAKRAKKSASRKQTPRSLPRLPSSISASYRRIWPGQNWWSALAWRCCTPTTRRRVSMRIRRCH